MLDIDLDYSILEAIDFDPWIPCEAHSCSGRDAHEAAVLNDWGCPCGAKLPVCSDAMPRILNRAELARLGRSDIYCSKCGNAPLQFIGFIPIN